MTKEEAYKPVADDIDKVIKAYINMDTDFRDGKKMQRHVAELQHLHGVKMLIWRLSKELPLFN